MIIFYLNSLQDSQLWSGFWEQFTADLSTLLNSAFFQAKPAQPNSLESTAVFLLFEPEGTKHKTMLEARTGVGAIKSFPRSGVKSKLATSTKSSMGLQNKTFYCEICDVHVNSDTQLKQVRDIFKSTLFTFFIYSRSKKNPTTWFPKSVF